MIVRIQNQEALLVLVGGVPFPISRPFGVVVQTRERRDEDDAAAAAAAAKAVLWRRAQ